MNILKKILRWSFIFLVALNLLLIVSGKSYIYKALVNTYLQGRSAPAIDEFTIFPYSEVKAGSPQAWPVKTDYNKLDISENLLKEMESYGTVAFLVVKNDSLQFERYWESYSPSSISNSFSMAKTIVSILTGIALSEGKIGSLDQPVGDFIPEFREGKGADLKIRHLLTMSSGIDFDEDYANPLAYPAAAYYGDELRELSLSYEVTSEPGKTFIYLSGNTALLGMVLESATGMKLGEYASERLWKPVGAEHPAYWSLDHEGGLCKAYCCFNSNARDFARLGQLYLHKGSWNGRSIVPENYVRESITPAPLLEEDGTPNKRYGYSWWIMSYKGRQIFYARGILGQYIFVIPEEDLVVVRLGHRRDKKQQEGHPIDAFIYLDAAFNLSNPHSDASPL